MPKILDPDTKILLALAVLLLALTVFGVLFDLDSRARMDEFTTRIEAENAAEAERRAALDALLTKVREDPQPTKPRGVAGGAVPL
jgi:hypothetical protein